MNGGECQGGAARTRGHTYTVIPALDMSTLTPSSPKKKKTPYSNLTSTDSAYKRLLLFSPGFRPFAKSYPK